MPTDEQLCELIQAGDQAAANELVTRYRNLVKRLTSATSPPAHIEFDDVAQIGYIALFNAAKKWRANRGAMFKTVAYCYVGRAVRRYVKEESNRKRPEVNGLPDVLNAEPDRNRLPAAVAGYLDSLTPIQQAVVGLTFGLEGLPLGPALAGKVIGLARGAVQEILASAMGRLRELAAQPGHHEGNQLEWHSCRSVA